MSLYKTKAIVLRVIRYREADKIINFLSAEGHISAIARGSRKVKSRYAGLLEPFCFLDLVLHSSKNLHTVTQASLLKSYRNIREDYSKYLVATAAVELADKVTASGQKEEALFELLQQTLSHLDLNKTENRLILLYYDWQVIKILGLLPPLNSTEIPKMKSLTINVLKSIIKTNFEGLSGINPDKCTVDELFSATRQYMNYHLQVKLKTRSYIE